MRKNLLVATLIGFCVVGFTACSKGEDKSNDTTATPTTAMEQPVDQTQVPAQTAENTAAPAPVATDSTAAPAPAAEPANPVATDNTQTTTTTNSTTTTGTDTQGQPTQTTQSTSTSTTAPADTTAAPATPAPATTPAN